MRGTGKTQDVGADLGQEHLDRAPADASDGVQSVDLVLKRAEALGDLLAQLINQLVECIQMRQLLAEKKALVCVELSCKRTFQLRALGAQVAFGQVG